MFSFRRLAWGFFLAVVSGGGGAVAQQVVINEIHYEEDDATVHSEYVELHNPGERPIDLSGCYFSEGISLVFPSGTVLAPGGFLVACEDPAVVLAKWGVSGAGVFSWNAAGAAPRFGQLRNQGGSLVLRGVGGGKLDEVEYGQGFPWPTVGDPPNYSIELIHPLLDNQLGGNWRRSDGVGGGVAAAVLVPLGSAAWHYRPAWSEPSTPQEAWRAVGFSEDASWLTSEGGAPLGYGEVVDTELRDMVPNPPVTAGYSGIYLRHGFALSGPLGGPLKLRVFNDDGFVAWINGVEVARFGVGAGEAVGYDQFAARSHEFPVADEVVITAPNAILNVGSPGNPGQNVLTIHALNNSFTSSDFYVDAELGVVPSAKAAAPSPGAANSVLAANAPPAIRQVEAVAVGAGPPAEWPRSGQPVRIAARISDPEGVRAVSLAWQVVEPGDYISLSDPRFKALGSWTVLPMADGGVEGDEVAGDGVWSGLIPGSVQVHRRLIRYRLVAEDGLGGRVEVPYADDPQPNFAYYVYDELPTYSAKATPSSAAVAYGPSVLGTLPAYHLITRLAEHGDAQNVPLIQPDGSSRAPTAGAYGHS